MTRAEMTAETLLRALHRYTAGDLLGALEILDALPGADPLPDHVHWNVAELERRVAGDPAAINSAARDWVELARDRIRRELGEDVTAVVPVPLALTSALGVLGDQ